MSDNLKEVLVARFGSTAIQHEEEIRMAVIKDLKEKGYIECNSMNYDFCGQYKEENDCKDCPLN